MPEIKERSLAETIQFIDGIKKNYVNIIMQDHKRLTDKTLKSFLNTAELYLSASRFLHELQKHKES